MTEPAPEKAEQKEYTLRPNHGVTLDRPVEKIEPLGNEIVVAGPTIETQVVDATEFFEPDGAVPVIISATTTARVLVTYVA